MLRYQTGVDSRGRREGGNWHAGYFDLLAKACEVAGDLTKARETYEKIAGLTTGRLGYGATYAKSCCHLGLIAEQQGDKTRARGQPVRYLLDTCLISEFQKPRPAPAVRNWLARQHEGDLYLSVLTLDATVVTRDGTNISRAAARTFNPRNP